jgi:hypothetical protein
LHQKQKEHLTQIRESREWNWHHSSQLRSPHEVEVALEQRIKWQVDWKKKKKKEILLCLFVHKKPNDYTLKEWFNDYYHLRNKWCNSSLNFSQLRFSKSGYKFFQIGILVFQYQDISVYCVILVFN